MQKFQVKVNIMEYIYVKEIIPRLSYTAKINKKY